MPETVEFLVERLKTEGEKTLQSFSALTPEQWTQTVYTEGETWTIRSVLVHFVTAERAFIKLFTQIRDTGVGASDDFSIDRYNASQQNKNKEATPAELIEQFKTARAEMTALVSTFTPENLAITARHPFLGMSTLAEMIKMTYRHHQIHFRDMRHLTHE